MVIFFVGLIDKGAFFDPEILQISNLLILGFSFFLIVGFYGYLFQGYLKDKIFILYEHFSFFLGLILPILLLGLFILLLNNKKLDYDVNSMFLFSTLLLFFIIWDISPLLNLKIFLSLPFFIKTVSGFTTIKPTS